MPADRPEKCPTCESEDRSERFALDERGSVRDPFLGNVVAHPCDDPWHSTPTPPAPADDAKSPFPAPERAAFPSLYCAIYPDLIPVARSLGYALAIHGSVSRDLDLIAVPWTEDARPPEELVEAIRAKFDGWIGGATTGHPFGDKPHGRRAWSIMLGGHAVVDLSVVPVVGAPAAAPSRVEEARRAFYEAARESVRLERAVSDAFDAEVRTGRDHGEADLGAQANAARDEKEYAYDALLAAERAAITESTTP